MKKMLLSCVILFIFGPWFSRAESNLDTLPIGPSPFRLAIDKIETGQVLHTASMKAVSIPDMARENKYTDVFVIGEAHDNFDCHILQRDFIEALFKEHPQIVVGFEFFLREDNGALEAFRLGQIDEAELLKRTGWYQKSSLNYGYTRLVMEVIQKYRIKVIGLNVSRDILHQVSRRGFNTLPKEQQAMFPTLHLVNPEHEYFIKSVFGLFAAQVPMWFNNMYTAQKCWDVIMAESMRLTLAKPAFRGYKGVIIAGSNHVAYKLGIPFRFRAADKKARLTTIVPVFLPEEKEAGPAAADNPMMKAMAGMMKPAALFSRGIADYVFSISRPPIDYFPVFGLQLEIKEGKLAVTQVTAGSLAEKNGLSPGDIITAIDGIPVTSVEQVRWLLAQKNWDDSFNLDLIKKIDIKKE